MYQTHTFRHLIPQKPRAMNIERDIMLTLERWKNQPERKPVLLKGARQIGKSWVMEEFGRRYFEFVAKFDFDENPELQQIFKISKDPERILKELALFTDVPLLPGKTLILFDEIQECEEAFNALKYFREKMPQIHIISAGSLLGVAVKKKNMKVPVGQVDIINMFPVTFREFLRAADKTLFDYVDSITEAKHLPDIVLNKLKTEYRRYMVCGGMPEAASAMLENLGVAAVDKILSDILGMYEIDFAKYATPLQVSRIHALWHSLPTQLAKENRKFIYNIIKTGARSKDYEDALMWLEDAGVIYKIYNINKPALPLSAYADPSAFKIYACDIGLLRRLARLSADVIIAPTAGYSEFKGAIAENAVLQSLVGVRQGDLPYYWTSGNKAELEFITNIDANIIPIEVKAENCVSGRSLAVYNDKHKPTHRIRFSMLNLQKNDNLLSCPLPLADWLNRFIK